VMNWSIVDYDLKNYVVLLDSGDLTRLGCGLKDICSISEFIIVCLFGLDKY